MEKKKTAPAPNGVPIQKGKGVPKEGIKVVGTVAPKGVPSSEGKKIPTRGRSFGGYVIKKFKDRVVIRFERVKFISKYERYSKSQTKLHARLPAELGAEINVGDYIQIRECRPLSKIIHHIVVKKIREAKIQEEIKEAGK